MADLNDRGWSGADAARIANFQHAASAPDILLPASHSRSSLFCSGMFSARNTGFPCFR